MKRLFLTAVLMAAAPASYAQDLSQGFQLESAYTTMDNAHTVFGRAEYSEKDRLFAQSTSLAGETFNVGRMSAGYIYDLNLPTENKVGIGAVGSVYDLPERMEKPLGEHPASLMLVLRFKLN